ncbi:hypothetical protein RclHR1_21600002 [Rhizophagus clarus]|uniref:Crinkler effector protein N-terminal domain-containing protein n=1 Tax=Rhizophagus clarus TaxID=94130 RepID=A0A2Z6R6C1_9GLOM|nr:hypothetical protein RclHR1_21600002 [Rhizophagus clarus]
MSTSADNDIVSLNFCYRNAGNKNILFAIEISKDKTVPDLEEEVRKKLGQSTVMPSSAKSIPRRSLCKQKIGFFPILTRRLMMKTISISELFPSDYCLVVGENPYENVFEVDIDNNKTVNRLKKTIKEEQPQTFTNVDSKDIKLWKVNISLEEPNEKLVAVNTKINVNIKEDLGGEELPPLSKISKHFTSQPADEHIHIIVQRPVETKEVHCTATYGRKSANFQWIVTRETVTLEGFKKKLCEYFTFPDGTENEHIVIGRVVGGAGLKRKISTGKMRRKSDSSSQSATVESDTVEIVTERKVIQFSADEDLMSIIWTTNSKVDLEIVVDTLSTI